LESPPPEGFAIADKRILFTTFEPDTNNLSVYEIPENEILNAELKEKKVKND
jgi:hypothetical protein